MTSVIQIKRGTASAWTSANTVLAAGDVGFETDTKKMKVDNGESNIVFQNGFLDSTQFEVVDVVGNVYNRLVLFDAQFIHAASCYFGHTSSNGRLFQLFFFDFE